MNLSSDTESESDEAPRLNMKRGDLKQFLSTRRVLKFEEETEAANNTFNSRSRRRGQNHRPLTAFTLSTAHKNVCEVCDGLVIKMTAPEVSEDARAAHLTSRTHQRRLGILFPFRVDNCGKLFDRLSNWRISELEGMVPRWEQGATRSLATLRNVFHTRLQRRANARGDVLLGVAVLRPSCLPASVSQDEDFSEAVQSDLLLLESSEPSMADADATSSSSQGASPFRREQSEVEYIEGCLAVDFGCTLDKYGISHNPVYC